MLHSSDLGRGLCVCAQPREMGGRKHHPQQEVTTWNQPSVEIQHYDMRKYNLVELRRHLSNIIICSFIKAGSGCCTEMLSNEQLKPFSLHFKKDIV